MPRRRRRRSARKRARPQPQRRPFLRRRSTYWLIAAVVTLTVGIVLGIIANATDGGGEPPAPTPTLAVELPAFDVASGPAEVINVIDGDTIDVRLPDGNRERVRYYGIDTPERGEPCYDEATERNEQLVGETVLLAPDARERDPFGRLLRYAFVDDGTSVEARLIAEGLGVAWRADGAFRDELVALEQEARELGVGCLWSE